MQLFFIIPLSLLCSCTSQIIDAHFSSLLLDTNSRALLLQLNEDVSLQKEECRVAGDLTGILAFVAQKRTIVRKPIGQYTVEEISY